MMGGDGGGHGPHPARGIVLADVEAFSHLDRIGVEGWEGQVPDRARRVLVGWSRSGPRRAAPGVPWFSLGARGAKDAGNGSPSRDRNARDGIPRERSIVKNTRVSDLCTVSGAQSARLRTLPAMYTVLASPISAVHRVGPAEKLSCLPRTPRPVNAPNRPRATLPPRVSHLVRARTPLTRFARCVDPSVKPPGGSDARQCGPVPSVLAPEARLRDESETDRAKSCRAKSYEA